MSLETDDAMSEVVPESMTPADWAHVGRVTEAARRLVETKYPRGKAEHGGSCWLKPGMLAHALDEVADLSVYLYTQREQMVALAQRCRQNAVTLSEAADEIERWLKP